MSRGQLQAELGRLLAFIESPGFEALPGAEQARVRDETESVISKLTTSL